jgi:hypothetical protein
VIKRLIENGSARLPQPFCLVCYGATHRHFNSAKLVSQSRRKHTVNDHGSCREHQDQSVISTHVNVPPNAMWPGELVDRNKRRGGILSVMSCPATELPMLRIVRPVPASNNKRGKTRRPKLSMIAIHGHRAGALPPLQQRKRFVRPRP